MELLFKFRDYVFTPTPHSVREALDNLRYVRLQQHIPILYVALMIIVATAALATTGDFPLSLQLFAPAVMIAICAVRLSVWVRRRKRVIDVSNARSRLRSVLLACFLVSGISSAWCVASWFETAASHQPYVPIYEALGALAATFCIASFRKAAILCLVVCLFPICSILIASGDHMHFALGTCILACSFLQARLIEQQHDQIVESLLLEQSMRKLADTDTLTGLPNRRAFFAALDRHIIAADASSHFAVGLLDLDGFKPVNDRLGHLSGDVLLQIIAERFLRQCGDFAMIARIGGDEFALLFRDTSDLRALNAKTTALLASLVEPCTISSRRVAVSASLGIAHYPRDGKSAESLMRAADAALYQAKAGGRAQVCGLAAVG